MAELNQRVDRLNPAQRRALLERLDRQEPASAAVDRRGRQRLPYRRTHVAISITQPGGGAVACTVPTRDLASGGLSFVYWGFLYNGTEVRCALPRPHGGTDLVDGAVCWCRHLAGANHLIGIRFHKPVQPELYLERDDGLSNNRAFNPRALRGRLLVLAGHELDRRLIAHYLRQTSVDFVCVDSPELALEVSARQPFDLVLYDLDDAGDEAERAMAALRIAGSEAIFIAITAETDPMRLRRVREAGAADVLRKPLAEDPFLRTIARRIGPEAAAAEGALHSELAGRGLDELIAGFVREARRRAQELRNLLILDDLPGLRRLCTQLRGNGGAYGFPTVTDAALDAILAIDTAAAPADAAPSIRRLCDLLTHLVAPVPIAAA